MVETPYYLPFSLSYQICCTCCCTTSFSRHFFPVIKQGQAVSDSTPHSSIYLVVIEYMGFHTIQQWVFRLSVMGMIFTFTSRHQYTYICMTSAGAGTSGQLEGKTGRSQLYTIFCCEMKQFISTIKMNVNNELVKKKYLEMPTSSIL